MKICEHIRTKPIKGSTSTEWFEWAKTQEYPWADSAITQTYNSLVKVNCLSEAINHGVDWFSTTEGFDYWGNIYNDLIRFKT